MFFGPSPEFGIDRHGDIPEDFLHYKTVLEDLLDPLGWNDIPGDAKLSAYVVEVSPIPVPASIVIALTGLAMFVGVSQLRRKFAVNTEPHPHAGPPACMSVLGMPAGEVSQRG